MPFRLGGNNAKDESATGVLFNLFVEGNYILQLNGSRVILGSQCGTPILRIPARKRWCVER